MAPLVIGLAVGAAEASGDEKKEEGQRYLAAATAKNSPWTHMTPQAIQTANPVGDIAAGGMAGLQYGQQNPNSMDISSPADTAGGIPGDPASQVGVSAGLQAGLGTNAYNSAINQAAGPVTPHSAIIGAANGGVQSLNSLQGKKGAMVGPGSNSWQQLLQQLGGGGVSNA